MENTNNINWEEREFLCASILMAGLAANPVNEQFSGKSLATLALSSAHSLITLMKSRQEGNN